MELKINDLIDGYPKYKKYLKISKNEKLLKKIYYAEAFSFFISALSILMIIFLCKNENLIKNINSITSFIMFFILIITLIFPLIIFAIRMIIYKKYKLSKYIESKRIVTWNLKDIHFKTKYGEYYYYFNISNNNITVFHNYISNQLYNHLLEKYPNSLIYWVQSQYKAKVNFTKEMEPVITKELNLILDEIIDTIKAKNIDMTIPLENITITHEIAQQELKKDLIS